MITTGTEDQPLPPVRCACGTVTVLLPGNRITELPKQYRELAEYDRDTDQTLLDTLCTRTTQSTFAPGHDARFKGLLQQAQRFGGEVGVQQGGVLVTMSPVDLAASVAPALVEFVTNPSPVRPKRTRPTATKNEPVQVRARVGRWEYDGLITKVGKGPDATEHFHYVDSEGNPKVSSKFTVVTAS